MDLVGRGRLAGRWLPGKRDLSGRCLCRQVGGRGRWREIGPGRRQQHGRPLRGDLERQRPFGDGRPGPAEAVGQPCSLGQAPGHVDLHVLRLRGQVQHGHTGLRVGPPQERERADLVVGVDELQIALAQRDVVAPERSQRPVPRLEVLVDRVPRVGPAIVRVVVTRQPGFGAVVDRGHARPGELERGKLAELGLARRQVLLGFLERGVVPAGCQRPQDARRVVAVDEVQQGIEGRLRVVLHEARHARGELARREPDDRPVEVGRVAVEQSDHRSSEAVVHRRVGLVPEQPRGGVVPLLAEHQRVRIGRLYGFPDLAHEAVRQVVHDIEAPAGRTIRDPAPRDPVRTGEQVVDLGALDHLGDRVEPEPALVVGVGPVLGRRRAGRRLVCSRWRGT